MIKAIIFDYFGVIGTDAFWNVAHEVAGYNGDSTELSKIIKKMDDGELSWQQFCEDTGALLGVSAEHVNKRALEVKVNKHLIVFIQELKNKGLKVGLLSNASSGYLRPLMEQAHISHLFDEIVVSSDVGVSKPNPIIFKEILSRLAVEPHEAIFIDDVQGNVDGAENVGMYGVQFINNVQIQAEIHKLLAQ